MSMGSNPVFPNISNYYNLSIISNLINIHKLQKSLTFKILYSQKNLNIVKIFKNINLIYQYSLIRKNNINYILINLNFFNTKKIGTNLKIISKPSKKVYISYTALRILAKRTGRSIFLISTTNGIITHHEALKYKLSGVVVGFVTL